MEFPGRRSKSREIFDDFYKIISEGKLSAGRRLPRELDICEPVCGQVAALAETETETESSNLMWGGYLMAQHLIRQPCRELNSVAVHAMLQRLKYPNLPARRIELTPELVIRRSCGGGA